MKRREFITLLGARRCGPLQAHQIAALARSIAWIRALYK
jgi:hypothetical protein